MNKKEQQIVSSLALFLLLGFVIFCHSVYVKRVERQKTENAINQTKAEVEAVANKLLLLSGSRDQDKSSLDAWGNEIVSEFESTDEEVRAQAFSKGPDGLINTPDDISYTVSDVNVSRMVGRWVGKTSKETVKGVWEGLRN